jgi:hypothetical protein
VQCEEFGKMFPDDAFVAEINIQLTHIRMIPPNKIQIFLWKLELGMGVRPKKGEGHKRQDLYRGLIAKVNYVITHMKREGIQIPDRDPKKKPQPVMYIPLTDQGEDLSKLDTLFIIQKDIQLTMDKYVSKVPKKFDNCYSNRNKYILENNLLTEEDNNTINEQHKQRTEILTTLQQESLEKFYNQLLFMQRSLKQKTDPEARKLCIYLTLRGFIQREIERRGVNGELEYQK